MNQKERNQKRIDELEVELEELKRQLEDLKNERDMLENPSIQIYGFSKTPSLERNGIKTCIQLYEYLYKNRDLGQIRNIGEKAIEEIYAKVENEHKELKDLRILTFKISKLEIKIEGLQKEKKDIEDPLISTYDFGKYTNRILKALGKNRCERISDLRKHIKNGKIEGIRGIGQISEEVIINALAEQDE